MQSLNQPWWKQRKMALQSQYEDFKKVMVYTMLPRQSTNRICKEKWGLENVCSDLQHGYSVIAATQGWCTARIECKWITKYTALAEVLFLISLRLEMFQIWNICDLYVFCSFWNVPDLEHFVLLEPPRDFSAYIRYVVYVALERTFSMRHTFRMSQIR